MIVMKFGGTSVGSAESIRLVRDIVLERVEAQPVVVVSAVSGVTNLLVELAQADGSDRGELLARHMEVIAGLWNEPPVDLVRYIKETIRQTFEDARALPGSQRSDLIISLGERLSSRIVSDFISERHPAKQSLASDILVTNDAFGAAEILDKESAEKVTSFKQDIIDGNYIPVVTGFIGATKDGRITTLGRGGSDYSAALLGYYLEADEVQIWTDVDGVFTTDPRNNENAKLIPEITYQEASELAAFGAKVLHPKTMRPAVHGRIPIRIANTFRPDAPTTKIVAESDRKRQVIAVATKKSVVMVNMYAAEMLLSKGFLARISSVFAGHNISIDIVSASEASVSLTLDNHEQLEAAVDELREFSEVTVNSEVGLVSLIGQAISYSPTLLALVTKELAAMEIELDMVSVGASGINISLVLPSSSVERVADRLHDICIGGNE